MPNEPGKKPVVHSKKHIARLERERRQSRYILYGFIAILVIVVGLIGYGILDVKVLQSRRPVAKVGDVKIISKDFESRVRLQRQQLLIQYSQMQYYQAFGLDVSSQTSQIESRLNDSQGLGEQVLNQMINEELIRQEAAKLGVTVTEEELQKYIEDNYGFFPSGTPTPTITPTEFLTPTVPAQAFQIVTITPTFAPTAAATVTLASIPTEGTVTDLTGTPVPPSATPTFAPTNTVTPTEGPTSTPLPTATPYTLEGFQKEYKDSAESFAKFGFSEEQYRNLFYMQLLREKLQTEVTKDVPHTEEQVWARHILVADEETAKSVIQRLKNGEDFGALAKELSTDTGSAQNGGDLGWFGKGQMVAPFEEAAFSLQPGAISDPVQSDFGYHVIQVIARQERPLSESAYQQKVNQAFSDFLDKAKEEIGVEIYDFWKQRVPTEPNFITAATEAANAAKTSDAQTASAPTETPTPTP